MSFRTELISICMRVSAAAAITYFSVKYLTRLLDPNYNLKQEAKKKVEELMQRLDIDFPVELNEYELRIATQLVPPDANEGVSWDSIGGYDSVIQELKSRVIKPLRARAHGRLPSAGTLLNPAKGILCYGPPGCGKTLICRALARSACARFIQLDLSGLTDKWYGESQKLAAAVFSLARKLQPCIIFIDEIDSFLRVRQSSDNEATAMMKAQFMSLWDGFSSGDDAIIVVGATNRPQDVDAAILRRMPLRFFIELPDEAARASILRTILKHEYADSNINYEKIAKATRNMNFSGSDLREVCRLAALTRLQEVEDSDNWIKPSAITIRESDLLASVQKYSRDAIPTFAQMILEEAD
ncbi:hypothetical protein M3Y94_00479200 [Aphelenchoides besseyi]|nr:hypothetical protein M3Y94_00479200 [Aphelenchoides besseyi]KAI6219892.1 Mitochondrial sorting-like protein [Aphelenchoides besseyi]